MLLVPATVAGTCLSRGMRSNGSDLVYTASIVSMMPVWRVVKNERRRFYIRVSCNRTRVCGD